MRSQTIQKFYITALGVFLLAPAAAGKDTMGDALTAVETPAHFAQPAPDAVKSPSGLASKVLRSGDGTEHPDGNDMVAVHYTGWTPDGNQFTSSYDAGKHAQFSLQQIFPGWREGLQMMVVGEKRRLWIPAHLAPQNPASGPKGAVVFDVELLAIRSIPDPPETMRPPADAERLPNGGFTRVVEPGAGEARPGPESMVLMNYTGWDKNGTVFDSTIERGRPTSFLLDKVTPAFSEAVQQMTVGEKRNLWLPERVIYGRWPNAPRGMLVFEVELLQIMSQDSPLREGEDGKPELVLPEGAAVAPGGGDS